MHLGLIQSYPGGNHDFQFLWPYAKRHAGFDQVLVTGPKGTWHPPEASFFGCSRDAYVDGDNLPQKLTVSVGYALANYQFDWMTVEEYDVWHCRDFVREVPPGVMCGICVGGRLPGCENEWFTHWPCSATRGTWSEWFKAALTLLYEGRRQNGHPDAFLAVACQMAGIEPKFDAWHGFSRNTIHGLNPANPNQPDFLPEARAAYQAGCRVMHGVKSSRVYACAVEQTVREITRP